MQGKKCIAVFGGSFNPPLISHILLAKDILNKYLNIDKLIFAPVSTKYNKANLESDIDRYNMLKLICNQNSKFEVSDIELKSDKQLKTIETLNLIKQKYKDHLICFIMGTDNLKEVENWYNPEQILKNFKILVLNRNEDNLQDIIENSELLKKYKNSLIEVNNKRTSLSSTEIRNKIKNKEDIKEYVDKEVLKYITEKKLYIK